MSDRATEALGILAALGFPKEQQNERSALSLLSILGMTAETPWADARAPLIGITPIMEWIAQHHGKTYAPNTRETIRRQTMHQFVAAGLALYNPDAPGRAVNSPKAVYQIAPEALTLLQKYGTPAWPTALESYLSERQTLAAQYARERESQRIPLEVAPGETITLSAGEHSELIRDIVEVFGPHFAPGSRLVYVGDTGAKRGYFDSAYLARLGVTVDSHGKMPDVVLHDTKRNWLLLIESVTSHGPVDGKRHAELTHLFAPSTAGLVYVTAFPSRTVLARYVTQIAWETEVWAADNPTHLIHFNGVRFLGPYAPAAGPETP